MSKCEVINKDVFEAIASLKDRQECIDFFADLFTKAEIEKMAQRFHIACLICEGKTYREVVDETSAANITISRVKKALNNEKSMLRAVYKEVSNQ